MSFVCTLIAPFAGNLWWIFRGESRQPNAALPSPDQSGISVCAYRDAGGFCQGQLRNFPMPSLHFNCGLTKDQLLWLETHSCFFQWLDIADNLSLSAVGLEVEGKTKYGTRLAGLNLGLTLWEICDPPPQNESHVTILRFWYWWKALEMLILIVLKSYKSGNVKKCCGLRKVGGHEGLFSTPLFILVCSRKLVQVTNDSFCGGGSHMSWSLSWSG